MIQAEGLTKFYGEVRAVHDVSFQIAEGEIVGILGLNGAGKSTILQILSGGLNATSGSVRIGGLDAAEHSREVRRRVGFLPEEPPLYLEMTVEAYLRFVGRLKGMTAADVDGRMTQVLEQTNIDGVRHQVIQTLSHGFRKRVGIAQAIIHDPQLLILDEPISGLDPVQIVEMRDLIRGLRGNHTILLSSHILTEISQTCDRILMIGAGEIVAAGSEDELVGQFAAGENLVLLLRGERDALEALLVADDRVAEHQVQGELGGVIEVRVTLEGDTREELVAALVAAGFGLRGMRSSEQELERAFLAMIQTGGQA
jgi:ABC-2 type transport system ATP-binding protein